MAGEGGFPAEEDLVTCFRQDDGALVCERLPPGRYAIETAPPTWEGRAFCSVSNPSQCVTYCVIREDGQLVCEGLPEGSYVVKSATDNDVEHMVEHIWHMRTYAEDDEDDQEESA